MGLADWIKLLTGVEQINASKVIYDEYKYQIEQLKLRVKELESVKVNVVSTVELELFIERESEYHKQIIDLINENRNLKEYILFTTKKNKDGNEKED